MVMVKSFDKDHHFPNLHILVTILFFHEIQAKQFKHTEYKVNLT